MAETVLKRGSRGEAVKDLQRQLNALHAQMVKRGHQFVEDADTIGTNIMPLHEDGVYGKNTEAAVRALQQYAREINLRTRDGRLLEVDGISGQQTLSALRTLSSMPDAHEPKEGPALASLQTPLRLDTPPPAVTKPDMPRVTREARQPSQTREASAGFPTQSASAGEPLAAPLVVRVAQPSSFREYLLAEALRMREAAQEFSGTNRAQAMRLGLSAVAENPWRFAQGDVDVYRLCAITTATLCGMALARIEGSPVNAAELFQGTEHRERLTENARDIMPKTALASVESQVSYAKNIGAWHSQNSGYVPKPGDMLVQMRGGDRHISIITSVYERNGERFVTYIDNRVIESDPKYSADIPARVTPYSGAPSAGDLSYSFINSAELYIAAQIAGRAPAIAPQPSPQAVARR